MTNEPIEVLHVDAHAITLRLPSGHEFGVAFYPPAEPRGDGITDDTAALAGADRAVVTYLGRRDPETQEAV